VRAPCPNAHQTAESHWMQLWRPRTMHTPEPRLGPTTGHLLRPMASPVRFGQGHLPLDRCPKADSRMVRYRPDAAEKPRKLVSTQRIFCAGSATPQDGLCGECEPPNSDSGDLMRSRPNPEVPVKVCTTRFCCRDTRSTEE
jgi:hypothetical protein